MLSRQIHPYGHNQDMKTNSSENIGDKVKKARKAKKLTLVQLAEKTGLSIGYLSNLERGLSSPTLDNLQSVCGAMEVSLISLLSGEPETRIIIRKNERELLLDKPEGVRYESANYGDDKLGGLFITLQPKCTHDTNWYHSYDEMGIVLSGTMQIRIEDQVYHLEEGDSFYIKANTRHSLGNTSDAPCESYWVK
jgi:transcriptional regulator with XRE-family HTH domain